MRRAMFAAIVAASALLGSGQAAEIAQPVWLQAPDRDDWAKAYPAEAAKAGLEGRVRLSCTASSAGRLEHCATLEEAPTGHGFADAALSLTAGMQLAATLQNGQPSAGKAVIVPVRFTPDLMRPSVITNPDWLKKPRGEDFSTVWPTAAHGGPGAATVGCVVTNRGLLEKCEVVAESPANQGFGHAALLMTPSFLMRPMTVDGQPVGGATVRIPVKWAGGGGLGSGQWSTPIRIAEHLPWAQTPSPADMAAAYPRWAVGKVESGHVVLRCEVASGGGLRDCVKVTAEPEGRGFDVEAMRLARQFKTALSADQLKATPNLYVNLPFDFRDPSRPSPALEIVDPQWLTTVNPAAVARLFPKAAADAGLKTGRGVVLCDIAHGGALNNCQVVGEEPAGYGFGAAAQTIANTMILNPWTQQGAPAEGSRVRLPVRLNIGDAAPAAKP